MCHAILTDHHTCLVSGVSWYTKHAVCKILCSMVFSSLVVSVLSGALETISQTWDSNDTNSTNIIGHIYPCAGADLYITYSSTLPYVIVIMGWKSERAKYK